jgi:hypothetical protein
MSNFSAFHQGDLVRYTGNKFRAEIGTHVGEVVAAVDGSPGALVVDFGGDSAFILSETNLRRPDPHKDQGIEIVRKPRVTEEE